MKRHSKSALNLIFLAAAVCLQLHAQAGYVDIAVTSASDNVPQAATPGDIS